MRYGIRGCDIVIYWTKLQSSYSKEFVAMMINYYTPIKLAKYSIHKTAKLVQYRVGSFIFLFIT